MGRDWKVRLWGWGLLGRPYGQRGPLGVTQLQSPTAPSQGDASMGAQPKETVGHVLGGYLRTLANGLEKFGNTLSPQGAPGLWLL